MRQVKVDCALCGMCQHATACDLVSFTGEVPFKVATYILHARTRGRYGAHLHAHTYARMNTHADGRTRGRLTD